MSGGNDFKHEMAISVPAGISIEIQHDSIANIVRVYFRDRVEPVDGKPHAGMSNKADCSPVASGDPAAKSFAADVDEFDSRLVDSGNAV